MLLEQLVHPGFDPVRGAEATRRYVQGKASIIFMEHRKNKRTPAAVHGPRSKSASVASTNFATVRNEGIGQIEQRLNGRRCRWGRKRGASPRRVRPGRTPTLSWSLGCREGSERRGPVAIVWLCPDSVESYVAAGCLVALKPNVSVRIMSAPAETKL